MTVTERTTPAELTAPQRWRIEQLIRLGMEDWQAEVLALDASTTWSDARKLIEDGCPPHLAFDITR